MKEEEIEKQAEEYAKIRQQSVINSKTITIVNEVKKQAFKDGAKWGIANAIEWHDLRKNPNDLPKHSGLYCAQNGEVREYVKEEKSWFTVHFEPCMNRTDETYLWCELPQFKDKE